MSLSRSGVLLPPYIVYKAVHLYPTWLEGPAGSLHNTMKKFFLTSKNCLEKVLLGNNLPSHTSIHVLEICEQNDIHFVLLPPNATYLLQPLDVAFFRPFKKIKNKGCIPKAQFPAFLKQAVENVANVEQTIKSGFLTCGIVLVNADTVLKRIKNSRQ